MRSALIWSSVLCLGWSLVGGYLYGPALASALLAITACWVKPYSPRPALEDRVRPIGGK